MSSRPLSLHGHRLSCSAQLAGEGAGMGVLDRTLLSLVCRSKEVKF